MNVTIREIISAREALTNLGQQKLPIKIGYSVSKIVRFANKELAAFATVRSDILKEHNSSDEQTEITDDINSKINEALDAIVEIPVFKIDLSSLNQVELTARDIMALEPFCIFETTELGLS